MKKNASELFSKWLQPINGGSAAIALYGERSGKRSTGLKHLNSLLADHFVGTDVVLRAGGFEKAAMVIANSLPTNKKTQSGDLGELLATEYVNSETTFVVPIKKLRWKSDRQMAMHGNDVIGVDATTTPPRVLKVECKSRASFGAAVASEAGESLDLHEGRANPSTLAFIMKRLYEERRDEEAELFLNLQCRQSSARSTLQMIFVLSGNDPTTHLDPGPKSRFRGIKRKNAAIVIDKHGKFIDTVFNSYGA